MDCHRITRAHETTEHIRMKRDGILELKKRGFPSIFPEYYYCDVVALRLVNSKAMILGAEFERSSRNVDRNVTRNYLNGCHYSLVVASTSSVYDSCVRKLQKNLSTDDSERTFIITFDEFLAGRFPHQLSQVDLCSDFVQNPNPICSVWFSLVHEKPEFVQKENK